MYNYIYSYICVQISSIECAVHVAIVCYVHVKLASYSFPCHINTYNMRKYIFKKEIYGKSVTFKAKPCN